MKVIFNSRLISDENFALDIRDRAFCYGDGLFETIVTGPERLNLIDFHYDRLRRGCLVLGMKFPFASPKELTEHINTLRQRNGLSDDLRIRVQVWRNSGGLYTPTGSDSSFLISCSMHEVPFYRSIDSLGDCKSARVVKTDISFAKTMSALPYVLAGIEKDTRGVDDVLIKNSDGHIAETISSNIFWKKNNEIYTPSTQSGCIEGVLRKYLLQTFSSNGVKCHEVIKVPEDLMSAKSIFLTNASGITWVKNYNGLDFNNPVDFLQAHIRLPQHP